MKYLFIALLTFIAFAVNAENVNTTVDVAQIEIMQLDVYQLDADVIVMHMPVERIETDVSVIKNDAFSFVAYHEGIEARNYKPKINLQTHKILLGNIDAITLFKRPRDGLKQIDLDRSYRSIVDRGLITEDTTFDDWFWKLDEETQEVYQEKNNKNRLAEELADVIIVATNMAKFYNIDIEDEIKNKIIINERRAHETKQTAEKKKDAETIKNRKQSKDPKQKNV